MAEGHQLFELQRAEILRQKQTKKKRLREVLQGANLPAMHLPHQLLTLQLTQVIKRQRREGKK